MNQKPNNYRPWALRYLLIILTIISMSFALDLYFKVTDVRYSYLGPLEDELQTINESENILNVFKALLIEIKSATEKTGAPLELQAVIDEMDEYVNDAQIWFEQHQLDIETKHDNYEERVLIH